MLLWIAAKHCFFESKMANFKKLILNMVMVFVILLSMNLAAAAARVPLWISQSHHKPGDKGSNDWDFMSVVGSHSDLRL
ncbi:hypothetical protein ACSQ67_009835 [Phaseolus vulgaris]